jgi:hypothetical protein
MRCPNILSLREPSRRPCPARRLPYWSAPLRIQHFLRYRTRPTVDDFGWRWGLGVNRSRRHIGSRRAHSADGKNGNCETKLFHDSFQEDERSQGGVTDGFIGIPQPRLYLERHSLPISARAELQSTIDLFLRFRDSSAEQTSAAKMKKQLKKIVSNCDGLDRSAVLGPTRAICAVWR